MERILDVHVLDEHDGSGWKVLVIYDGLKSSVVHHFAPGELNDAQAVARVERAVEAQVRLGRRARDLFRS